MNISEYKGVFVFAQQIDGEVSPVSYELLGKATELAKDLNTTVTAVLAGSKIEGQCSKLAEYGAQRVIVVDDPVLETYSTEPYTHLIDVVIHKYKPEVLIYAATAIGRDLAPRVAARVHTGLTADCTGLAIDPETKNLMMTRPAFGGNLMATIRCPNFRPQMATVRPGVMKKIAAIKGAKAEVIVEKIADLKMNVEILEIVKEVQKRMKIEDAKVLVSGGRGMGGPQNFKILEDLAEALGGTISASRAAVDAGWIEKDRQVGQTGKTVRPNLYIACGISGAIQHLAGMEDSNLIIAINKDEFAPIFEVADYGIVGDALKVVPLLTAAVKAEKAKKAAL